MAIAGGLMLATSLSQAYEAGDWILRAGVAGVLPTGESESIPGLPQGAKVEASDAWSLGLTGTYMVTGKIGIGLLAAWPFSHDIDARGSIKDLGTVAETKQLPPTLTVQYHFDTASSFHPYVGLGINYTNFFDTDTKGALKGLNLELDSSWGLAAEAGLDYEIANNWLITGQVWYLDLDTRANLKGVSKFDVNVDPWVVMIGVGKRF